MIELKRLNITKIIKSKQQPKILKHILTHLNLKNTQHMESQNAKIKDLDYVIKS